MYEITLYGYVPDGTYNTTTFKLKILSESFVPPVDTPPYFRTPPNNLIIEAGNTSIAWLPTYYDLNPIDNVTVSYKIEY